MVDVCHGDSYILIFFTNSDDDSEGTVIDIEEQMRYRLVGHRLQHAVQ